MTFSFDELQSWYAACDPDGVPIESVSDPRYVALDAWPDPVDPQKLHTLRGPSAADHLARIIRLNTRAGAGQSTQLFSGFRGSGKSTELARVRANLEAASYTVLSFRVDTYHPMSEALSIEELDLVLVAGIGEALEALLGGKGAKVKKPVWEQITGFLRDVKPEVEFGFSGVTLKTELRGGKGFASQLAEALRNRPGRLKEFVHDYVRAVVSECPNNLVVLVDGLEKYYAPTERISEVYRAVSDVFFHHASLLKLPDCHTIYTVPPYLAVLNKGVADAYGGRVKVLASVPVRARPPRREHVASAIAALRTVLEKRFPLAQLFDAAELETCVESLCLASGGHVRDLLHLTRDVMMLSMESSQLAGQRIEPVGNSVVSLAIALMAQARGDIFASTLQMLKKIAANGSLDALDEADLPDLTRVMDQSLVLHYHHGEPWYDVHPLLHHRLAPAAP